MGAREIGYTILHAAEILLTRKCHYNYSNNAHSQGLLQVFIPSYPSILGLNVSCFLEIHQ